ncbi:hypothetical protein FHT40_004891 [Mycolicibacterium sp. BK556]|uniref:hypothetical protein n=1 Tax=Mycobacteriaceae TaxID=1762 RepID=UPI00105DBE30|nr:hypothetical protein [Mycobacterium sp. BK086]MBB3605207.1 hypothetical protein [Mycolicibacterium sp. BK556]MBB3635403.1 hypothetical protein [Mycolicibacterium sp. BK607]TDO08062.1 hypothetical protein EV580_5632 [Mycobacterium sp. BK086]
MSHQQPSEAPARPADVDTGFWLWLIALPLMVIGYVANAYFAAGKQASFLVVGVSVLIALTVAAVVVTFLFLMRSGYRWTRTLLTGGGLATVIYTGANLFGADRDPVQAVIFAVTGIIGSVLILGGAFLLHRQDAQGFFTK